jgi:hypothetical protein
VARRRSIKNEKAHYFFPNPYEDAAFTRCPKCEAKTRIRKFPLVIHIEPDQLLVMNKSCRYCVGCDLIIVKRSALEAQMAHGFESIRPEVIGNEYFAVGTLDRKDWRQSLQGKLSQKQAIDRVRIFKDTWGFEVVPAHWAPTPEKAHKK